MKGSQTRANVDITVQNNVTWNDAYQFDPPSDSDDDDDTVDTQDNDSDDAAPTWTLNGQNFRLDIKGNPQDIPPLLSLSSTVGEIVVNDAVNRIIQMNVPESVLNDALVPGEYFYDLVMYDNSVPPIRVALMGGRFNFTIGITGG